MAQKNALLIRGKQFTEEEVEIIKKVLGEYPCGSRRFQSKVICERINWRQPNGRVKDRACRDVLLRMNERGFINCPPIRLKRVRRNGGQARKDAVIFHEPGYEITGKAGDYKKVHFEMVRNTEKEALWDYLIDTYHYLGYQVPVGHYLKYFIYIDNYFAGCIGFADAVLKLGIRDKWIGWDVELREKNLHFIINNNRYLIFPWVKVKYLSSKTLGKIARAVRGDWEAFYGYKPILLETFVDKEKFSGTSYKAANWVCLGSTKGKGRRGMHYFYHGKIKDVYVYPLIKNFRDILFI